MFASRVFFLLSPPDFLLIPSPPLLRSYPEEMRICEPKLNFRPDLVNGRFVVAQLFDITTVIFIIVNITEEEVEKGGERKRNISSPFVLSALFLSIYPRYVTAEVNVYSYFIRRIDSKIGK